MDSRTTSFTAIVSWYLPLKEKDNKTMDSLDSCERLIVAD
jgi:hypothetical protein